MEKEVYKAHNPIRVITATSLFDGHDASINIMRRILQANGAEVIHLGHNRSAEEIVNAAIEEDVQGIAVSSYQGGHVEFFKYIIDMLKDKGAGDIKVFGGGGGVITPSETKELENYGVTKIYSPEDGSKMGLNGIILHMIENLDFNTTNNFNFDLLSLSSNNKLHVAKCITYLEKNEDKAIESVIKEKIQNTNIPVIGFTGAGGAGKSSLIDEILIRILNDFSDIKIGLISIDPSRKKTGGALLGDRIRMNAIYNNQVYMRSLATRSSKAELSHALVKAIDVLKSSNFNLIIAETAGIGQGDTAIVDVSDISIFTMTAEFGASTQLEKINMLDYADIVAVNKFEKHGGEDTVRMVRKQIIRNKNAWDIKPEDMPVFGTSASRFNDDGVTALYLHLLNLINEKKGINLTSKFENPNTKTSTLKTQMIPSNRVRYLSKISETIRNYHAKTDEEATNVQKYWHLKETSKFLGENSLGISELRNLISEQESAIDRETFELLDNWEKTKEKYSGPDFVYNVRDKEIHVALYTESLSRSLIPKVALPKFNDPSQIYKWIRTENIPGDFPYTAGVFPFKRTDEDPTRMFAGEGDSFRTNKRFKVLSENYEAKRLSTAFDSATLYGHDPDKRQDIYGKIGNSGVSICTLDDMKILYSGFNLCAPNTSVSMTINGPAPIILAMFFNTAIEQLVDNLKKETGRNPNKDEYENIKKDALSKVRGTVQADILKEDQGQNTCIFSTEFALKLMGDVQEYFIQNNVRNFYSVSISGYHIAEAGANPITQLALTLANGFTYVEYYLSRGMNIDNFAPNFSFFFSNGLDIEYTVIGRVARRIWAIAMKELYGACDRSQMLKYHIQTSGRSLHSQEIQFNDIRTTLQALCAIYDNCNSLHTNSYDEAITTPSEESVRRALAIQLIINREWGLSKNENSLQGSFIVEELTNLVEEAVLMEFDRISARGGVLGAMELGYQRDKIQEESLYYERLKDSGNLPIIGVNTFKSPNGDVHEDSYKIPLARSTSDEKESQLKRLGDFKNRNLPYSVDALKRLKNVVFSGKNVFAELMETVKFCSLGEIVSCLYEAGGKYRRNM
ncbi:MAG: methylmalonyl-CoA mutase family protein [Desulfobacterales bacterium]|nr:methylmalonyl-CoA mutase family protein [Desulfobacterales bacterium]